MDSKNHGAKYPGMNSGPNEPHACARRTVRCGPDSRSRSLDLCDVDGADRWYVGRSAGGGFLQSYWPVSCEVGSTRHNWFPTEAILWYVPPLGRLINQSFPDKIEMFHNTDVGVKLVKSRTSIE